MTNGTGLRLRADCPTCTDGTGTAEHDYESNPCPTCCVDACDSGDDLMPGIVFVEIPCHNEVCGRCEGRGTHVNPSIDGNGITSGVYDVPCEKCKGRNVVSVPNSDGLTELQLAAIKWEDDADRSRAEDARTAWYESGCPR